MPAMFGSSLRAAALVAALATVAGVQLRAGQAEANLAAAAAAAAQASHDQIVVWVSGYGRSATSTVLSIVGQAKKDSVFQVFEPCHDGDRLAPWLKKRGCDGLLSQLASCNFTGVEWLYGLADKHTTLNASNYSPADANRRCANADFVAFKTVDQAHDLDDALPLLEKTPNLRMLDVVRDPRGVWASWKSTWPLNGLLETKEFRHLMTDTCETFAKNLNRYHPRVHRVVFEELMADPRKVMRGIYSFLNVSMGESQEAWMNSTFDAKDCQADSDQYADCRSNATVTVERWHSVLNQTELATFRDNRHCQEVAATYGYELQ